MPAGQGSPPPPSLSVAFHMVVHIGTDNAKGLKPDDLQGKQAIVDGIWNELFDRSVERVDGTEMKYTHIGVPIDLHE